MQERFHNYNRPVLSFDENKRLLGLLWPGRYCGFENAILGVNSITITHAPSGIVETQLDQTTTLPKGIYVTRQGVVIKESEPIGPLVIASNASNAFKRIDTIVAEHEINQIAGGSAAIYSVIQGPDGESNPGPLTAPEKQIILGYLEIPASSATTSGATYIPSPVYHPGGLKAAFIDKNNKFSNLNEFNATSTPRLALSDGINTWVGVGSLSANTIENVNGVLANQISFLPRTQKGSFLFIVNKSSSALALWHTANDSVNTLLPSNIWEDYFAINTISESEVLIGAGGWAILHCAEDGLNGFYNVLLTSTEYLSLASVQSSLTLLNNAITGRVNRTVEPWKTVGGVGTGTSFGANFSASAGKTPQFKKDDNNTVYIRGAVNWGSGGSNTIVFTLPSGYRPNQQLTFAQMVLDEPINLTINPNGNVELFSPLGGISAAPFNLTCQFRID